MTLYIFKWCNWIPSKCNISIIWLYISNWCKLNPNFFFLSTRDIFEFYKQVSKEEHKIKIYGILIIACYCIWKARNDSYFSNTVVNPKNILEDIKSFGLNFVVSFQYIQLYQEKQCGRGGGGADLLRLMSPIKSLSWIYYVSKKNIFQVLYS